MTLKHKIYFRFLFVAILLLANAGGFAQGVGNHVTMTLENTSQPSLNTIEFDLMVTSDGVGTSDLKMNSVSYGVNYDTGILPSGATIGVAGISGTTHPIFLSPTLSFPVSSSPDHIQIIQSPYSGGVTGPTMAVGQKYRASRIRLTSSTDWVLNSNPSFSLQDSVAAGHTDCNASMYVGGSSSVTAFSVTGTGNGQRNVSATGSITLKNCSLSVSGSSYASTGCAGVSGSVWIVANGTPPYSYLWNNGSTKSSVSGLSAGTYSVTVTDYNACPVTEYITINQINQAYQLNAFAQSGTIVCNGGSTTVTVSASGGTTPYSGIGTYYRTAGTYTFVVTDANGCTTVTSATITEPPPFSIATTVVNATCGGCSDGSATVSVTGGTPAYSYSWCSTQTTSTAGNLSAGTYCFCVTDANGCTFCDSATVGVGSCSAGFTLIPDTAILHHYFAVKSAIGISPITYLWSWGDGTTDTAAYPNHTYASAGIYNICLAITDAVSCTNSYCYSSYLQRPDMTMISITVVHSLTSGVGNGNNLYQNIKLFPNPTNGSVAISYSLAKSSDVIIGVYNSYGQLVKELSNGWQTAGRQETVFDAQKLATGIYFVKVIVDGNATVLKLAKM